MSQAATRSPLVRHVIAPLTTVFTPPSTCVTAFIDEPRTKPVHNIVPAYYSDCQSLRPCLPGTNHWSDWGFYSPGLSCPQGWTTATVASRNMTDIVKATAMFSLMYPEETAAFCCPSGFAFSYGLFDSTYWNIPPRCVSAMVEGDFNYWTCGINGETTTSELRTFAINSGEITTVATSTEVTTRYESAPDLDSSGEATTETVTMTSTITTKAPTVAMTLVPAVQLVWRPIDGPSIPNPYSSSESTAAPTSAPSPTPGRGIPIPVIAGSAAGAGVLIAVLLLGIFIRTKRRQQRGPQSHTPRKTDPDQQGSPDATITPSLGEPTIPAIGLSYKAELDAIATAQRDFRRPAVKPELPGDALIRFGAAPKTYYELDAEPPYSSATMSNPVSPLSAQPASPRAQC
ncbi:hypothetical protein MFIFM68171_05740 [Madurella fahalii]|uniref:Uncharacterized protein n=1 Tax=Madurella fahalii TaxID=1157608 RepID=A0ABQ0GCP3_9PEZI